MKISRMLLLLALLVAVTFVTWYALSHRGPSLGNHITVYYTKIDGTSEIPWQVTIRPPERGESAAAYEQYAVTYAATQAIAGPPSSVQAVRFPPGTHVLSANVTGSTATINLSKEVENQVGGTFGENGEFKSLVWSVTSLPGIEAVAVRIDGKRLDTLPGGHLELDQPLHRSDW